MRSLLALTISTLVLSGCVTETSYKGTDKPVPENTVNNDSVARTRISLALQYLAAGNNAQAKYNLERAMEFAPKSPEVHYSLAYYYQQVGEDALADKSYQKALNIKPDDPNTLNNYGVFLCSIDKYDQATDQFLKAIAVPSYIRVAESYENLALCAIEFDDFDAAESYFIQAMNHSSQRDSTLISLAALYYAKSDLHKSQDLLRKYENKGRISPRSLLLKYLIKQRMGHLEEAEKIALTIVQTYPKSNEASLLRGNETRKSEFEILRDRYRKATLKALQNDAPITQTHTPKIKIKRKKRAAGNTDTAVTTTAQNQAIAKAIATEPTSLVAPTTTKDTSDTIEIATLTAAAEAPAAQHNSSEIAAALLTTTMPKAKPSHVSIEPKTVSSAYPNNDTSAVLSAITETTQTPSVVAAQSKPAVVSEVKPAPQPEPTPQQAKASPVTQAEQGVKIISFGAPKATNVKNQQDQRSVTATSTSTNDGTVVFYQTNKDDVVFSSNSNPNQYTVAQPSANTAHQQALPMLNPKVSPLKVPFHIIQFGENLFSISVRYNVKLQKLLQWNGLKESDRVVNGTKIYLNDPNIYYEIKAGDTLYDIATQQQVLIDQLMRWNKLSPDIELKPGHRLLLVNPDSYTL